MKEEQKPHLIDMMQKDEELGLYDVFNDEKRQGVKELIDKHKQGRYKIENDFLKCLRNSKVVYEPKQETLEEAGEKLYPNRESFLHRFQNIERKAFIKGAKWNQENILELLRSNGYEDEPIFDLINNYLKS